VTEPRPCASLHTLATIEPGRPVRVLTVAHADAAELAREGLMPGSVVTVRSRTPLGGPLVVALGRARLALASPLAARINVERVAPADLR
jgi:Fe2+ transport system protein FeoA